MEELVENLLNEVQKVFPPNRRVTGVIIESKDVNFLPDQTRVEVLMEYAKGIEYPRVLIPLDPGIRD